MTARLALRFLGTALLASVSLSGAEARSITPEQLQQYLKQYPEADTNHDGVLTLAEARAYLQKRRGGKAGKAEPAATKDLPPSFADVAYGPHARNVLDFWQAKSDRPAPVVVFIHGGGFTSGDKSKAGGAATIQPYLDAGVSFAAINYRYRTTAPIQDVLRDCARAIQFIRSKSVTWNIDKTRVAAYGGSAGAGTSLWLAFHDDLADPANPDPVLRESTRLTCAGANATQFTYDVLQWASVLGEESTRRFAAADDVPGFYGFRTSAELDSEAGRRIRADCDIRGLISRDDPPAFLAVNRSAGDIDDRGDLLHHPKHTQAIFDRCREMGVPVIADVPSLGLKPPPDGPTQLRAFLLLQLTAKIRAP